VLRKAVVFLLLGVILTVAVGWGTWGVSEQRPYRITPADEIIWPRFGWPLR
jgi:hypothetical protein